MTTVIKAMFLLSLVGCKGAAPVTSAVQAAPSTSTLLSCDKAYLTVPYGTPSTTQTLWITDVGVLQYLLTGGSADTVPNRPFLLPYSDMAQAMDANGELAFIGPNSTPVDPSTSLDAYASLGLDLNILSFIGVPTQTNTPVLPDGSNFSGSLAELTPGKQVRTTLQGGNLTVSLFDTGTNAEASNWIFRGCQAAQ